MNADKILSFIGVFIASVALLLAPSTDTFLEPLRIPLIYLALGIIVILAVWLVVIAIRKSLPFEAKVLLAMSKKLGVSRDDINNAQKP